jgi:hypothetical protein
MTSLPPIDQRTKLKAAKPPVKFALGGKSATPGPVFVSHVAEDYERALKIVDQLERRGIRCWIAPRDVRAGRSFDDQIEAAIEACWAMLLILSSRNKQSNYIRREVTVADDIGKIIIRFRIENVQPQKGLRMRLIGVHWVDAFNRRQDAISAVVQALESPTTDAHSLRPLRGRAARGKRSR